MPPDSKADLAHPEAADWVLGTLGPAQAEDFRRHLTDCPHCRAAVAEFGELGQMLQHDVRWVPVVDENDHYLGVLTPNRLHAAMRRSVGGNEAMDD